MNDLSLSDLAAWLDAHPDARLTCRSGDACGGWTVHIVSPRAFANWWSETIGEALTAAMEQFEYRERGAA